MKKALLSIIVCALCMNESGAQNYEDTNKTIKGSELQNSRIAQIQLLANSDNADAQYTLGILTFHGHLLPQSYKEAFNWFLLSANNGNSVAQYNIGAMYEHGYGQEKSIRKAIEWYSKAANAGQINALNNLGYQYDPSRPDKTFTTKNMQDALYWYDKSMKQRNIQNVYAGTHAMGPHDIVPYKSEAIEWFEDLEKNPVSAKNFYSGNCSKKGFENKLFGNCKKRPMPKIDW